MIKVLHVAEELASVGGTPRKLFYLVKHARAEEVAHHFLCFQEADMDQEFRRLGASVTIVHSTAPLVIVGAIVRVVRSAGIGVISTHFARSHLCGWIASKLTGVPLMHNEHGPALPLVGLSAKRRLSRRLRRLLLREAQVVVCNSAYTAQTIRSELAAPAAALRVAHNPVESRDCVNTIRAIDDSSATQLTIGHVGGLIGVRDQATLVRSVDVLRRRGVPARLLLVGDGPLRGQIESLVAKLHLQAHVSLLGYRSDIGELLAGIDVYVNAATAEGFGIAVVEAMLASVPVVLADAGAHRELIADGAAGMLFAPGQPHALADCLEALWRDPRHRLLLGAKARRHAFESFPPRRYAAAYEGMVRELALGMPRMEAAT